MYIYNFASLKKKTVPDRRGGLGPEILGNSCARPHGFNGSVDIPESCDFRSQFDSLNIFF